MPILTIREETKTLRIGVWEITETLAELLKRTTEFGLDVSDCRAFQAPKRQMQCLAVRLLLAKLLPTNAIQLMYDQHGKPYLQNGPYLSISHSHDMVAVIVNYRQATGIDIERYSEKVKRIETRFLNETEQQMIDRHHEIDHLLVCWGGKEALYKAYGKKELIFKRQLIISPFSFQEQGVFEGKIHTTKGNQPYTLKYEKIHHYTLVYLLNS
jgi:4'-phosphopantetheinyl transferase